MMTQHETTRLLTYWRANKARPRTNKVSRRTAKGKSVEPLPHSRQFKAWERKNKPRKWYQ